MGIYTREELTVIFMYNKIYIIGPVGSGKTTLSNQLSEKYSIEKYELDKIVYAEFQKRLEGLYIELDGEPYKHLFKKTNMEDVADFDVINTIKESGTDYFIYLELLEIVKEKLSMMNY